jgi:hypothetical protein
MTSPSEFTANRTVEDEFAETPFHLTLIGCKSKKTHNKNLMPSHHHTMFSQRFASFYFLSSLSSISSHHQLHTTEYLKLKVYLNIEVTILLVLYN